MPFIVYPKTSAKSPLNKESWDLGPHNLLRYCTMHLAEGGVDRTRVLWRVLAR